MKLFPLKSAEEMEEELFQRNRSRLHIPVVATAYALFFALMLVYGPVVIQAWIDRNSSSPEDFGPDHNSY